MNKAIIVENKESDLEDIKLILDDLGYKYSKYVSIADIVDDESIINTLNEPHSLIITDILDKDADDLSSEEIINLAKNNIQKIADLKVKSKSPFIVITKMDMDDFIDAIKCLKNNANIKKMFKNNIDNAIYRIKYEQNSYLTYYDNNFLIFTKPYMKSCFYENDSDYKKEIKEWRALLSNEISIIMQKQNHID